MSMTQKMTQKIIVDNFFISNDKKEQNFSFKWQKSVFDFYCFLEKENILKEVSFNYVKRVEEKGTFYEFSFDVAELVDELKKNKILKRLLQKKEFQFATDLLFKKKICPCEYCGGISLLNPMLTYRDTGNVSRSWECCLCKYRINSKVNEISEYHHKKAHSTRDTISRFWFE